MHQAHYTKLLSSHFSGDQIETLIPIIEIMQDPLQLKAGVKELVKQGLYDPFVNFLEKYMKEKGMTKYSPESNVISPLITYMFSTEMLAIQNSSNDVTLFENLNAKRNIYATQAILPIFSKGLICRMVDLFSNTPITASNLDDVVQPIETLMLVTQHETKELNLNVKKMELLGDMLTTTQQHYFYPQLEDLELKFITLTSDCIIHLDNLTRLKIYGCHNILDLKFPANISHIECRIAPNENATEIIKHLIKK